jgi:hypothetical protein
LLDYPVIAFQGSGDKLISSEIVILYIDVKITFHLPFVFYLAFNKYFLLLYFLLTEDNETCEGKICIPSNQAK